jgi:hypothetical protein
LSDEPARIVREKQTIEAMIRLYCRDLHGTRGEQCADCRELLDYARARLDRCPFQENKPTCNRCPVHCYEPGMRTRIAGVMRHSGPRMLRCHPLLALRHVLDGLKHRR